MKESKILQGFLLVALLFGYTIANPRPDDDDDDNDKAEAPPESGDPDADLSAKPKCISQGDFFDPVNLVPDEDLGDWGGTNTNSSASSAYYSNNDTSIVWKKLSVNRYYGVYRDRFFVRNIDGLIHIQLRDGEPYSWATIMGIEDDWKNEYIFARANFFYSQSKDHGSMHAIWGSDYALEVQFVHYKKSFASFVDATQEKHGVLVICILFESTGKQTTYMDAFVSAAIMSVFPTDKFHAAHGPLDIKALFPSDMTNLQYTGEYIVAPCAKEAKFLVMINPRMVAEKQLSKLREVRDHEGKKNDGLFGNFMAVSPNEGKKAKVSRNVRLFVEKSAVLAGIMQSINQWYNSNILVGQSARITTKIYNFDIFIPRD